MNDFEKVIRFAVESGKSLDEIAEQTGNILNKIQAEQSSKIDQRKVLLDTLESIFDKAYTSKSVGINNAIDFMTLIAGETNSSWTKEDILEYRKSLENFHNITTKLIGKNPEDMLNEFCDCISDLLDKTIATVDKETTEKGCNHDCVCHNKEKDKDKVADDKAVQEFLNMLFPN